MTAHAPACPSFQSSTVVWCSNDHACAEPRHVFGKSTAALAADDPQLEDALLLLSSAPIARWRHALQSNPGAFRGGECRWWNLIELERSTDDVTSWGSHIRLRYCRQASKKVTKNCSDSKSVVFHIKLVWHTLFLSRLKTSAQLL